MARDGETVLEAARRAGVKIPSLCHHPDLMPSEGICRLCLIKTNNSKGLVPSCQTQVCPDLEVITDDEEIIKTRKVNLELLWADHAGKCAQCAKNGNCELQRLAQEYDVDEFKFVPRRNELLSDDELDMLKNNWIHTVYDDANPCIVRDSQYCVECRRCIRVCRDIQSIGALEMNYRSSMTNVGTPYEMPLDCIFCGQCANLCPTAAIVEKDETELLLKAINDPQIIVVAQVDSSIKFTFGELLGCQVGTNSIEKIVSFLKTLGCDYVFDSSALANLAVVEEAEEFIGRIRKGGPFPMLTSWCPSWIILIEKYYPELIANLSSCKSLQQMMGVLIKSYFAYRKKFNSKTIFSVSVTPCTSKKYEVRRSDHKSGDIADVDLVITVRELGRLLRRKVIDVEKLPQLDFDPALGISTGGGLLFDRSGSLAEETIKTVVERLTGKKISLIDWTDSKEKNVKEATVVLANQELKICIINGIKNTRPIIQKIISGKSDYHFIEVMACPDGCVGGGGQPLPSDRAVRLKRIEAIKAWEEKSRLKKANEDPVVNTLYHEFLFKPGSKIAKKYLHTSYVNRNEALLKTLYKP